MQFLSYMNRSNAPRFDRRETSSDSLQSFRTVNGSVY